VPVKVVCGAYEQENIETLSLGLYRVKAKKLNRDYESKLVIQ